jgi:hypothetical protein
MKKRMLSSVVSMLLIWCAVIFLIGCNDYRRDSRHFFCLPNGRCITMWRTIQGICYVIPGKYEGSICPPTSESYIVSPFTEGMDIIWEKGTNSIIVNLEDEKQQIIHELPNGIRIQSYNLNKTYNDSIFLYFDGKYERYKKIVEFISIDIKDEFANGSEAVTDEK